MVPQNLHYYHLYYFVDFFAVLGTVLRNAFGPQNQNLGSFFSAILTGEIPFRMFFSILRTPKGSLNRTKKQLTLGESKNTQIDQIKFDRIPL